MIGFCDYSDSREEINDFYIKAMKIIEKIGTDDHFLEFAINFLEN
jgi:hypothetical protein